MGKRIAFISERQPYPLRIGGAELDTYTMIRALVARGHECAWIGSQPYAPPVAEWIKTPGLSGAFERTDMTIAGLNGAPETLPERLYFAGQYHSYRILLTLLSEFDGFVYGCIHFWKPDLVVTYAESAHKIATLCNSFEPHVPCALLIKDASPSATWPVWGQALPQIHNTFSPKFFAHSQFIQQQVETHCRTKIDFFYPPIDLDIYRIAEQSEQDQQHITLFNPVLEKGSKLFKEVAAALPEFSFMVVPVWESEIDDLAELSALKNVLVVPRTTQDIRPLLAKTKLLLVPSRFPEAFGRVVIEAQVNGIPVLASNHGGLPEAVGDGGLLLPAEDAPSWRNEVRRLMQDESAYAALAQKARANAARFDVKQTLTPFLEYYEL